MHNEKLHIINLAKKGTFQTSGSYATGPEDVDRIFTRMAETQADHLAVYFHGGLVSEQRGIEAAIRLLPSFQAAGTYPVFFVWESGWQETIGDNLAAILDEPLFKTIVEWVFKFVLGKLSEQPGAHGLTLDLPPTSDVHAELSSPAPFAAFDDSSARQNLSELTPEQLAQFENALSQSRQLEDRLFEILDSIEEAPGVAAPDEEMPQPRLVSTQTRLSSEVLEQIQADNPDGSHGLISTAALVKLGATVLARTIRRLLNKTDHGVYTTVIEETLRGLYADQIGRWLWDRMKARIEDAFAPNGHLSGANLHGGTYFLEKLKAHLERHPEFKVSLIGHSAGGIYICRFIANAARLAPALKYHRVVMLAPGCDFELFRASILPNQERIGLFRMFALSDTLECKDAIASAAYPRSLLYFVSGVLEGDDEKPIVGMQRFYGGKEPYDQPALGEVCTYVAAAPNVVWTTVGDAQPGLNSLAAGHGKFSDDPTTIESLSYLLST
ncbi:MAG: hypothetical protein ACOYYS_17040 [Chloroflexota bacterium]